MKVVVLFNAVDSTDDPAELDVLGQCKSVSQSLSRLGHTAVPLACSLDLEHLRQSLRQIGADVVVNLVESLGGSDRMMVLATLLLESLRLPMTGCGSEAILRSGDKLRSKRAMSAAGIPTPAWFDPDVGDWTANGRTVDPPRRLIIKAVYEHASCGITDSSVFEWQTRLHLLDRLDQIYEQTRRMPIAEEFIDGREFNLSLLEHDGRAKVLPVAEIDFSQLPPAKPRIVGASAKWDADSIEYQLTPRRFSFPKADQPLLAHLSELAMQCWRLFELSGYARVDFRVSQSGAPFVLEVNANPCLSPDAGFAAAVAAAGLDFDEAINTLLLSAMRSQTGMAPCL